MARNGSGSMAIVNVFAPSTTISSSKVNANFTDIGNEITNSVAVDGQSTMTAPLKLANGTVSAPGLTFGSDTNVGMYRIGADNIGIAVNGAKVLDIETTGLSITGTVTPSGQIVSSAGDASAPGMAFASDLDCGFYRIGANNIGLSIGGTKLIDYAAAAISITGTLGVSGDFAINTNKFTVAASSGNTAIAGTLAVTGASQFTGQATFTAVPVMPIPLVVQAVDATPYTTSEQITAGIPVDDTAPASDEGMEILTKAITPLASGDKIKVSVDGFGFSTGTGSSIVVALFRGSTCIYASRRGFNSAYADIGFTFIDSPSTTSSTTYSVRVGGTSGASIYMNGSSVTRLFGGVAACTMRLEELRAAS